MTREYRVEVTVIGLSPPLGLGINCTAFALHWAGAIRLRKIALIMLQSPGRASGGACRRVLVCESVEPSGPTRSGASQMDGKLFLVNLYGVEGESGAVDFATEALDFIDFWPVPLPSGEPFSSFTFEEWYWALV